MISHVLTLNLDQRKRRVMHAGTTSVLIWIIYYLCCTTGVDSAWHSIAWTDTLTQPIG